MATELFDNGGGGEEMAIPVWKSYLYQLQLKAPKPKRITCHNENTSRSRPPYYGREYHGAISREEADRLLCKGDGSYLIRESQRAPGTYTLAMRFESITKNFKLYYDGQHYVGEKRFDTVQDLVADGLITFYLESKAADYIAALANHSNYEESPYMAYNTQRKKRSDGQKKDPVREGYKSNIEISPNITEAAPTQNQALPEGPPTSPVSVSINAREYEKAHNFKAHTFKGPHWCDFCANFLWGLVTQGVKCQDCGFNAHKKCSEKVPHDCLPDMKYVKRIFGVDLTTLVKAQNKTVPIVVEMCVYEIEKRGLDDEGLYRVAGFHDDVEAIRLAFDKDGEKTDITETKYEDINTITSLLKLFFRMLPIPLITFEAYPQFMDSVKREGLIEQERVKLLKESLVLLPPANYQTLKYFLSHLNRVTQRCNKNMMSSENLAIVFAPTLLRMPDTDPLASLTAVKFERELMELLILHQGMLFDQ